MHLHINTYGSYVHVKEAMFEIRKRNEQGEVEKQQFAASRVKGIVMTTGSALSTDAIRLAMQHNVDLLFVEHDGSPVGRVWHSKLGSTTKIRKTQLVASMGPEGLRWVKTWVLTKMGNQANFIKDLKKHRPQHTDYLEDKLRRLAALSLSVQSLEAERVSQVADTLRGLEGTAGRLYFETLSYVLPADYRFAGRSSRPARDAFNAFLNYAYGILYGRVEKALLVAGLDPYVGFLHRDDYNQLSMVFDFIEPYRAWADETVFRLFSAKKVNKAHTEPLAQGVTLNAEGKALLVEAFGRFLDQDSIRHRGRNLLRGVALQADAHQFANALLSQAPSLTDQPC
ncbi:CRISPR-associated protein Cas1 [Hymenobacter luteus]|uniref:CRISPR-associated endonuclease Cas1 n=2 Tax=Hymenobacter TaxID=89966 RepID=A0A7W9WCR1_9BACT|nr:MULTISPECIES: CRISPR-associated endonuclease Cas1 [Hymenobacter]MBB4601940.1 CRISPR-associated protein Cas1 [Hymenobacter latericoloratus]MBB6059631.1 CRISPR-associated protein Cas1 [Hymenobacter luteus]